MNQTKSFIGEVIFYDGRSHSRTNSFYQNQVIPAWLKIVEVYEELGLGDFTQKVYEEITSKGIASVRERYHAKQSTEVKALKGTLSNAISEALTRVNPFGKLDFAWGELNRIIVQETHGSLSHFVTTVIDHRFLKYDAENKDFQIESQLMETYFKKSISTNEQAEAWQAILNFQSAHNQLRKAISSRMPEKKAADLFADYKVVNTDFSIVDSTGHNNGFLFEDGGELKTNGEYFAALFNL